MPKMPLQTRPKMPLQTRNKYVFFGVVGIILVVNLDLTLQRTKSSVADTSTANSIGDVGALFNRSLQDIRANQQQQQHRKRSRSKLLKGRNNKNATVQATRATAIASIANLSPNPPSATTNPIENTAEATGAPTSSPTINPTNSPTDPPTTTPTSTTTTETSMPSTSIPTVTATSTITAVIDEPTPKSATIQMPTELSNNGNTITTQHNITDLNLAFLGDSLTRHMHLSLVYYLQRGSWDPDPRYIEGSFSSRKEHAVFISDQLYGSQACDCYRPEGNYMTNRRMAAVYSNMYYTSTNRSINNHISYNMKAGSFDAKGHWDPATVFLPEVHANHSSHNNDFPPEALVHKFSVPPYTWTGNWTYTIRNHIAQFQPRPQFLVLNAGMWPHELSDNTTLPAIRATLDELGILGIYKTTTKQSHETSTEWEPHDVEGCRWLHYCLDVSWTANRNDTNAGVVVTKEDYMDGKHFKGHIYARMNQQLLRLLQEIFNQTRLPNPPPATTTGATVAK